MDGTLWVPLAGIKAATMVPPPIDTPQFLELSSRRDAYIFSSIVVAIFSETRIAHSSRNAGCAKIALHFTHRHRSQRTYIVIFGPVQIKDAVVHKFKTRLEVVGHIAITNLLVHNPEKTMALGKSELFSQVR